MPGIKYKEFIEATFSIKNKRGEIVPFIFNDTQNYYYDLLIKEYPTKQGIRENILKFRQPGFSSFIDAIFTTDFIFSELGKIPLTDGDIVSHKEKETKVLFDRVSFFLDCFLAKHNLDRRGFLDIDTMLHLKGKRGAQLFVQTAGAKVSGRGGTKQNIHWSEVAFYSNTDVLNAEDLVTGAEQQVADGVGKIFRETTGNMSDDFFSTEYDKGKRGIGDFKSRFLGWWVHKEYVREAPEGWVIPDYYDRIRQEYEVSINQCYWHFTKTGELSDEKKLREYPTDETEAFLLGGQAYFSKEPLIWYINNAKKPEQEVLYVQNIV